MLCVYYLTFLGNMSFSIVLPTLWPYITDVCVREGREKEEGKGGQLLMKFFRMDKIIKKESILDGH